MQQELTESEKAFFDHSYASGARRPVWRYYAIIKSSAKCFRDLVFSGCSGKRVLEYGCGQGSLAFELARHGAEVVGIDISEFAIQQAAEKAEAEGLKITFQEMDAENLKFPPASFDLVCGQGILHHLNVDASMRALRMALKPGGRAIFSEPLGHNPALWLFRKLTPRLRTADEHPLLLGDLRVMRRHFDRVDITYFHLASFLAIPFLPTPFFFPVLGFMDGVDRFLFRWLPPFRSLAWYVVITLAEPRTEAGER